MQNLETVIDGDDLEEIEVFDKNELASNIQTSFYSEKSFTDYVVVFLPYFLIFAFVVGFLFLLYHNVIYFKTRNENRWLTERAVFLLENSFYNSESGLAATFLKDNNLEPHNWQQLLVANLVFEKELLMNKRLPSQNLFFLSKLFANAAPTQRPFSVVSRTFDTFATMSAHLFFLLEREFERVPLANFFGALDQFLTNGEPSLLNNPTFNYNEELHRFDFSIQESRKGMLETLKKVLESGTKPASVPKFGELDFSTSNWPEWICAELVGFGDRIQNSLHTFVNRVDVLDQVLLINETKSIEKQVPSFPNLAKLDMETSETLETSETDHLVFLAAFKKLLSQAPFAAIEQCSQNEINDVLVFLLQTFCEQTNAHWVTYDQNTLSVFDFLTAFLPDPDEVLDIISRSIPSHKSNQEKELFTFNGLPEELLGLLKNYENRIPLQPEQMYIPLKLLRKNNWILAAMFMQRFSSEQVPDSNIFLHWLLADNDKTKSFAKFLFLLAKLKNSDNILDLMLLVNPLDKES